MVVTAMVPTLINDDVSDVLAQWMVPTNLIRWNESI
jgi:hypothetical protein